MSELAFNTTFEALTGNAPFPWQQALYDRFTANRPDNIPPAATLPTGLGKTSVIAVWLIALANHPDKMPRRLVYVVNRRTVVDQTTDEVEKYRRPLADNGPPWSPVLLDISARLRALSSVPTAVPLAVSTLRGQFADNREWSANPSRPAIICGTVDMIGSRLLFSGYGVGFKGKPLHAGFLGQDALLIHDEAHLEPAFQKLIEAIRDEQKREPAPLGGRMRLKVMELTATSRGEQDAFPNPEEQAANEADPEVQRRLRAKKIIHLHQLKGTGKLSEQLVERAKTFEDKNRAVLVFARTVEDVAKVADKLPKDRVLTLTGTMRGKERDGLVEHPLFKRFLPGGQSDEPTTYLVCTSAGEVGVNISADHLVCDLSTFESMAQRFGRVNRFGRRDDTEIHVVHPTEFEKKDYEQRLAATLKLLKQLEERNRDASPAALSNLCAKDRLASFAPTPTILPTTDILFDAWALTTIREKLPGRPKVEPYLHGLPVAWEPPETHVAWRDEVELLQPKYDSEADREENEAEDRRKLAKLAEQLLDDFPLKPHEQLQDNMTRIRDRLDDIADRLPAAPAWVVDEDGNVVVTTLRELSKMEKRDGKTVYSIDTRHRTVLLPPFIGGLRDGMLDGKHVPRADDVSCEWFADKEKTLRRVRQFDNDDPPEGMRLVRKVELPSASADEDVALEQWFWFVRSRSADDDGSRTAHEPIRWQHHTDDVKTELNRMTGRLFRDDARLRQVLDLIARWHDLGKMRVIWQRSIGNPNSTDWHAKSGKDRTTGRTWKTRDMTEYRHEFGSLLDVYECPEFQALNTDEQDLVLHLIATHHGRGRPHFPQDEAFDPEPKGRTAVEVAAIAAEVPRRFARLQRTYGRWGLAYLESLLRAADWAASANPSPEGFVECEQ
jgi:CRISPR-associated endonuclease/helicase Cas3